MVAGSGHGSAAKGSAVELEVAGFGTVFPFPPLSLPCVVHYLVFHWEWEVVQYCWPVYVYLYWHGQSSLHWPLNARILETGID